MIRAPWTSTSQYYIDFDRGTVTHSFAAGRGQTNRTFRTADTAGTLKHLTYPQAADFYQKSKVGEFYFQFLRQL